MPTWSKIWERTKRLALNMAGSVNEHKLLTVAWLFVFLPLLIVFVILMMRTVQAKNTGFESKNLWKWMELLLVPAALGIAIWWLNRSEKASEHQTATDRMRETALQSYFDTMTELLLEDDSQTTSPEQINKLLKNRKVISRIRTLSAFRAVGSERKAQILLFLHESELIKNESSLIENSPFIDLRFADLKRIDLSNTSIDNSALNLVDMRDSVLVRTKMERVNLQQADLRWADIRNADLSLADLRNSNLANATLKGTILSDANLRGAYLYKSDLSDAVLRGVDFRDATLSSTDMTDANLDDADLRRANLQGSKVSQAQLDKVRKLDGATMPNGQKYEDWIVGITREQLKQN